MSSFLITIVAVNNKVGKNDKNRENTKSAKTD